MHKRILAIFVMICLLAVFTACTNTNKDIPKESTSSPSVQSSPDGSESVEETDEGSKSSRSNVEGTDEGSKSSKSNIEDWMLTLVNANNPLPDDYSPELKTLSNGLQFDARAIDQLNAMLSAAREQGLSPVVCSAYRSIEKQRSLFASQVAKQMANGLSKEQADIEARKVVAYPGTSGHNLGLSTDIVSLDYQLLDEAQADTPEVKWLLEHCSEYGFILRYPKDKTDITGILYEPWHFRYVGVQAAKEIMESDICLEEYIDMINN